MRFEHVGLTALCAYVLALVVVTEFARRARRDDTPADHFLAGRELGVLVLFLTLYATTYSGNSLLGYPGEAYRRGFTWIMATGFMMSIITTFQVLVPKLRPLAVVENFVTPGDWVRHRFGTEPWGRALVKAVAVLMIIALGNFLFAQLKAMGEMADQVTGGIVPYWLGVFALAGMILFYETRGGMRAVAWTDAAQGLLMLVGLTSLLIWLLQTSGGLGEMSRSVLQVRREAAVVPDSVECANWMSTILLLGLASVVYPQAIQRIYAARDGATLKRSLSLMSFMPLTTTLVVTLIGLAAIPRFSDLGAVEADRVMPILLGEWAAGGTVFTVAAVLVFLGALAAIMSTADSVLLSLGSMAAEDLLGAGRTDVATTALGKRIAAGVIIAMAVLALFREITLWDLIELKMELLIQCVPAFLVAIHWRRMRAGPALAGLAVGTIVAVGGFLLDMNRISGFHIGVLSLGLNLGIAVIGSAVSAAVDGAGAEQ